MQNRLLKTLTGNSVDRPALWMMRQAGRYLPEYLMVRQKAGSFWNLCFNPDLATEVTLQPIRRFDYDAAIIFSDILVIPQAMGQKVEFQAKKADDKKPTSDEIYAMKNKMLDEQIANKAEMKKILTPEQYKKWEENREEGKSKMKKRFAKRKGNTEETPKLEEK